MTTIYLSSTYEDLKEHRRAVFDALRQAEYQVIAMEDYVATDDRPVRKCLNDVERSDIYVGVFAFRYGYVPSNDHDNPDRLSITELEFRQAEGKKPCLIFLVKKGETWPLNFVDACTENDKGERIDRLREYLGREKTTSFFSSPYQLASLVQTAVTNLLKDSQNLQQTSKRTETPAITWDINADGSPYPGLMHFTRKYAPVFFGRQGEVREILDRICLPEGRFIIVSGGSGIGKSSLVDAGVLPRLEEAKSLRDGNCLCVRMVPSQGDHPFDALTRVLHSQVEQVGLNAYDLGKELVAQPAIFPELIQTIISKGMNNNGLVLFLDQMEELFTAQTKDHAKSFLSVLYRAVNEASLRVIATIRSDFLHHCHEHPDMLKVLNSRGHYGLGRVEPFMMRDMIVKPAACAALTVPDRLVSRLVQETSSEPGNLPLLAFVLQRLFDKRSGNALSEAVYDTLGGVAGAISDHIRTVEEKMIAKIGGGALDLLPRIFQSLLVVNEEGRPSRRGVPLANISTDLRDVVDILVSERLLSTEGERATVSVAHEKLFEVWPALAKWIGENQNDLFFLWRAEIEAREWEKHGFDLEYLWPVNRLKNLQVIVEKLRDRNIHPAVASYVAPQERLLKRLKERLLSHQDRLKIGNYLAAFGDPRIGVGLTPDDIPDIDWVDISEGNVELANAHGTFFVKSFRIARYPVTNLQFEAFVKATDGYSTDDWWEDIEQSRAPESPQWSEKNRPCNNVTWYEAVAFCRWLTQKYREKNLLKEDQEIQLPTEWEWQQAATGGDTAREYPWEGAWDTARCNSDESGLNCTTAVGVYPHGATLQGVLDMAGNVMEWCLNKYYEPRDRSSAVIDKSSTQRAQRGGAWNYGPGLLRSSYRIGGNPGFGRLGFRVAQKDLNTESLPDFETVSAQRHDSCLEEMEGALESEHTISKPGRIFYDILKDASNGPEMVVISPQTFRMGDVKGDGFDNELPVHTVHIQKAFAIGRYLITFEQYDQFVTRTNPQRYAPDDGPSHDELRISVGRGKQPVVNVSWHDAVEFARWLSLETGKSYRLPTEAEWEYAARSGGKQETWAGTSREQELKDYAWYEGNSSVRTHTVGSKKPNSLGLYDMSGNVWEWVEDCWHQNYKGAPTDGSAWLEATGGDCGQRVMRGGSWGSRPVYLRVSNRGRVGVGAGDRTGLIGFRLARNLDPIEVETKLSEAPVQASLGTASLSPDCDLSGTWSTSWTSVLLKLKHDAKLVIPTNHGNEFSALLTIEYIRSGEKTIVEERLTGNIRETKLLLTGVSYIYRQQGRALVYNLDSFELHVSKDGNTLNGKAFVTNGVLDITFVKKTAEPQSVTELASLEGHWVNTESGTHAYAKVINGELVAPYCFGGNHKLTGVYYGLRKTGDYWFARFKWLGGGLSGFSFLKRDSVDLLSGAWWSAEGKNVPDAPPKESGFQSTWKREKDWEPPSWALQFFEEVGREGLASRLNRD